MLNTIALKALGRWSETTRSVDNVVTKFLATKSACVISYHLQILQAFVKMASSLFVVFGLTDLLIVLFDNAGDTSEETVDEDDDCSNDLSVNGDSRPLSSLATKL